MSCNVFRIYWTLLLISVVSSCILFIIVASEGARSTKEETYAPVEDISSPDNATLQGNSHGIPDESLDSKFTSSKMMKDVDRSKEYPAITKNFQTIQQVENSANLAGIGLHGEGVTQQPNLSQGVPETDQAVLLTLVDTAAAELHNLAEPRINLEKRNRKTIANNLSLTLASVGLGAGVPPEIPLKVDIPIETISGTPIVQNLENVTRDEADIDSRTYDQLEIVVVRADQSGTTIATPVKLEDDDVVAANFPGKNIPGGTLFDNVERDGSVTVLDTVMEAEIVEVASESFSIKGKTESQEDIPSFSEWAQKRLEEAEKKKTHPNASVQNSGSSSNRGTGSLKVRSKNYASPDCGAKIVAANPEAGSPSSVLSSSRDEYMLNTCTSRIWFIVELCEALQAEKIELANFELFSSSPKDFSVYVGDRLPTRDWSPVGQFTAKDERDVQSFVLDPRLFGKFIKVEFQSHYGSEHFCPVSLFRVYGTSEFEALETENQIQEANDVDDDDDDVEEGESLDADGGAPPRNLFGSARDAVLSIVKKAAQVLVKSGNSPNNSEAVEDVTNDIFQISLSTDCQTPRYSIICNDTEYDQIFHLLSCHHRYINSLLTVPFIYQALNDGNLCRVHGVEVVDKLDKEKAMNVSEERNFLDAMLPSTYIVALCNMLAAHRSKVTVNSTIFDLKRNHSRGSVYVQDESITPPDGVFVDSSSTSLSIDQSARTSDSSCSKSSDTEPSLNIESSTPMLNNDAILIVNNAAHLIKPTKATSGDEIRFDASVPILEPSREPVEEAVLFQLPSITVPPTTERPIPGDQSTEDSELKMTTSDTWSQITPNYPPSSENGEPSETLTDVEINDAGASDAESETDNIGERDQEAKMSVQDQINLDTLLSDLKDLDGDSATPPSNNPTAASVTPTQPTTPTPQQKESVFLRLSNRIKTLERNMSLSGQYLEELSRRYKKQVEEMQRSLERAITTMNEQSRRGEERDAKRVEEISELREQVVGLTKSLKTLISDKDSWRGKFWLITQHIGLMAIEILIVLVVISYCRRSVDSEDETESCSETKISRRRSAEGAGGYTTNRKSRRRRPSEIAAARISGTYQELLIADDSVNEAHNETAKKERRKKRKRDLIVHLSSTANFSTRDKDRMDVPGGTNLPSRRASSSDAPNQLLVRELNRRPDSAPETSICWFIDQKTVDKDTDQSAVESGVDPHERGIEELSSPVSESRDSDGVVDSNLLASRTMGILKNRNLSTTHGFMKTALGSRKKRLMTNNSRKNGLATQTLPRLKSDNWEWYSKHSDSRSSQEDTTMQSSSEIANGDAFEKANGLRIEDTDDSQSGNTTPSRTKDNKKTSGLKKMVKKLF